MEWQQETDLQGLQAATRSGSPEAPLLLRWMQPPAGPELRQDSPATSVWGRSQAQLLKRRSFIFVKAAQLVDAVILVIQAFASSKSMLVALYSALLSKRHA